jgi:glycerol-3-phosphate cytidylyltransferase|tara:strand:- start:184 stop:600 length:417 start_codon:yes stop_codon:yes gene_type:complete
MKIGITFGTMDLFHAGHVLMLQEAKNHCDHLIVCIQTDPSVDRATKNSPVQSIVERQIQVAACRYVDEVIVYENEAAVMEILQSMEWHIRILGSEYRDQPFTGREETLDRCYFNRRQHQFSSSSLRERVVNSETNRGT